MTVPREAGREMVSPSLQEAALSQIRQTLFPRSQKLFPSSRSNLVSQ